MTYSPYFPQSNGCAERVVQTMKSLLKNSADPYLTMFTYRSTPLLWCGLSPAELLMGRRLRANVPQVVEQLKPEWGYLKEELQFKSKQKSDYNRRHGTHSLPPIPDDSEVWITSDRKHVISGRVTGQREMPRSYTVSIPDGSVHRNRHHLNAILSPPPISSPQPPPQPISPTQPTVRPTPNRIMTRSQQQVVEHRHFCWPKSW